MQKSKSYSKDTENNLNTLSYKILITGRVQQVGFRFFTLQLAQEYGINGSVQNLPSGQVMAICYGKKTDMLEFLLKLRQGPSRSFIANVELTEIAFELISGFTIK